MYSLNPRQIDQVTKRIIASGVSYAPLVSELTDHSCEQIEELMEEGYSFTEALDRAMGERQKEQYTQVDKNIIDNISYRAMLKNYLKLGVRSLAKYKLTSSINLASLILGISIFLFIGSYVHHELTFDQFHADADRVYRVSTARQLEDGGTSGSAFSGAPWGPEIIASLPKAADMVRMMKYRLPVAVRPTEGDKQFYESDMIWAGESFFSIFSFDLLQGDPASVLSSPNQVVITSSTAKRYFGDEDPIGKTITYENNVTLIVTGVARDFPINSHIQADIIGSFATLGRSFWFNIIDNWNVLYYYTYVKFDQEINPLDMESRISALVSSHMNSELKIILQPIASIHTSGNLENELTPNANASTLTISMLIGLSILLLSVINYVNLSNARALKRAREVGVIKVMGSSKWLVFVQFMVESFLLALLSFAIALGLVIMLFPEFEYFMDMQILMPPFSLIVVVGLSIVFFVAISAGLYTAYQMADVKIVSALKGKLHKKTNQTGFSLRKALIIFQFMSGIGLICATLIISDQVSFLMSADTGYAKAGRMEIPLPTDDQQILAPFENLLQELASIEYTSQSSHRMSGDQLYRSEYTTAISDSVVMGRLHIDYDFLETFDMQLLAGRDFSEDFSNDTSAFIVNESALGLLGYQNPEAAIGNRISYMAQNENGRYLKSGPIIGVVTDFNFESLHAKIGGMVMDIQPARNHFFNIKLRTVGDRAQTVSQIQERWAQVFPNDPFDYYFVDDRYLSQYHSEAQLQKIVLTFSVISILISAMGLFGLTYFDTTMRSKEIGIRKVLGASKLSILRIFLTDYLQLIIIGFVLVVPLVLWLMKGWLEDFAYHVDISMMSLVIPAVLIGTIMVLTTVSIIIKAASDNPIDAINYE